jgi:DNA-binding transcriptional MerR regulator
MTIGRFARISGLSIHTLRHYDDVDLLAPAQVDQATGYRRYRQGQVQSARLIQALRWIDLPVEEVRRVLANPTGDEARGILGRHRDGLTRQAGHVAARIADTERYLEEGISMPVVAGCRPVQIKVAVDDTDEAIGFYREAFGFRYDVTRRTQDADYSSFVFGTYGQADFFLLHHKSDPAEADRPGPTTFGLSVEDLDEFHARALAAGGTEVAPPHNPEGMPRCSAVRDPSGNWIWLYQA